MESESLSEICHLPEEIIIEILSRIPVKSLLRYKSTSKSWRSLISSKHFAKTHLKNSTNDSTIANHRILSVNKQPNCGIQHWSLHSLLFERVTYATRCDLLVDDSIYSLKLVDSCNGLVCILINRKDFFLWNPTTKESKKLPSYLDWSDYVIEDEFGCITERGFGFDESNGDYKVYGVFSTQYRAIAKIYSLKTDSWTSIHYSFEDGSTLFFRKGKFVSGNLHWLRTKSELNGGWYISSFDLKNEVYGIVDQPSVLDDDSDPILGVVNGCLSVFYYYPNLEHLDLWVLKQYDVKDSWNKLMRISDDPFRRFGLLVPLYITSQNREILFKSGRNLIVYNPKENLFQDPKKGSSNNFHKLVYIESLVSIVADVEE